MKKLMVVALCVPWLLVAQVKSGIEVLQEVGFAVLKGKRVGLITNATGISSTFTSTVDILANAKDVSLVALFGPEHGVRGDVTAGGYVEFYTDPVTHLPVYSLYGKTRKPSAEMLKGIDILVYDIQDIGSRSYTFINTLANAMEAAAEQKIPFVVLDRPNPLSGSRIEGNILDEQFKSFVGQYPIPYVYGMTCGEFATMVNDMGWLSNGVKCSLTVIPMEGWNRTMHWNDTALPWVPTSPHIPTSETALYYSAIGILGELQTVNIGVGYTMPFRLVGAEWIDSRMFAKALNAKKLPGIFFRETHYKPYYGDQQGKMLHGVELIITDVRSVNLTNIQLHVIETLLSLYPESNPFTLAGQGRIAMFDKVMGTDDVRNRLSRGEKASSIINSWNKEMERFQKIRSRYLIYE